VNPELLQRQRKRVGGKFLLATSPFSLEGSKAGTFKVGYGIGLKAEESVVSGCVRTWIGDLKLSDTLFDLPSQLLGNEAKGQLSK